MESRQQTLVFLSDTRKITNRYSSLAALIETVEIGLEKNVGAELCRFGIRVNGIAAAGMATEMVAAVLTGNPDDIDEAKRILAEASPLKDRPGLVEDVANAALWLASDESGYTNGHTLTTDAGITVGATVAGPAFSEYAPMIREAGRSGL